MNARSPATEGRVAIVDFAQEPLAPLDRVGVNRKIAEAARGNVRVLVLRNLEGLWLNAPEEVGIEALWRLPEMPVIAVVHGPLGGAGLGLALACDIVIASEDARFGTPEVLSGGMPDAVVMRQAARAAGKFRAMHWLLSGTMVSALTMLEMRLVSAVVPGSAIETVALSLGYEIAALAPLATRAIKESVTLGIEAPPAVALALEAKSFRLLFGTLDREEGIQAFREKRQPNFQGR